jgi:hypothetical protein
MLRPTELGGLETKLGPLIVREPCNNGERGPRLRRRDNAGWQSVSREILSWPVPSYGILKNGKIGRLSLSAPVVIFGLWT